MNYNAMLSGLRDLVDNPTPRVPVLLCLDTSGSMMGAPIHELNLGVQQYMAEMKSDDLTRCSAETAVVSFDDSADCVADFDTADRLQVPEMEAGGMTCMGEGRSLGLYLLEKRKAQYKATGVDYSSEELRSGAQESVVDSPESRTDGDAVLDGRDDFVDHP